MKSTNGLLGVGAVFALLLVFGMSGNAFAFHHPGGGPGPHHGSHHGSHHGGPGFHHGPGFGLGLGFAIAPRPSGYYQTVTETVMVAPEQVEQYWVPPVFNTVADASGNPQQVKVRDGYMASRVIPARYETISRQVWVPCGGPSVGVGLGFRF
jgi:hypothetical protein